MYFSPESKIRLNNGQEVTLQSLCDQMVATQSQECTTGVFTPLRADGALAILLGWEPRDAVRIVTKSRKEVICATDSKLVLAGGPGYDTYEGTLGMFDVLGADGPESIVITEPAGKVNLFGLKAQMSHAVLINGLWFLS